MKSFRGLLLVGMALVVGVAGQVAATPEVGETRTDEHGIEQVWVPAGCFMMGTSESEADYALELDAPAWAQRRITSEQPQHEVCLSEGYWIDTYEVTNAAYRAFIDAGGYTNTELWSEDGLAWLERQANRVLPPNCVGQRLDDQPQVCITWYEAEAYAAWRGGTLPTEAQWEFAARGEESLIYPWGNEWDTTLANVESSTGLMAVGSYPDGVSWVGAHDMAGNAMEWVSDWLSQTYYADMVRDDPTGPETGGQKVEKGGWWGSNSLVARAAYRHFEDPPTYQDRHIGVRIVSPAEAEVE